VVPVALLVEDALAVVALSGAARRAGLRFPLSFARPQALRCFARRAAAQMSGAAITRLNPLVDQAMAAAAGVAGGGTLLRLSQDVAGVPASLLQAALLPVLLSRLSADFAAGRHAQHRALTARALGVVAGLLAAASVALYAARGPLVAAVYLHGSMDAVGVARLARLLPFHLVGVVPFGLLLVLVRAHTSIGESRIMLAMGVANAALNVLLNLLLRPLLGLEGIALSTSLVSAAIALALWIRLGRARARREAGA
jgi:putative peptidoglycan lipid II flippase